MERAWERGSALGIHPAIELRKSVREPATKRLVHTARAQRRGQPRRTGWWCSNAKHTAASAVLERKESSTSFLLFPPAHRCARAG